MRDLCLTDESFIQLKALVLHENLRQLEKWGVQDLLPSEWLMLAVEELGETADAIGQWNYRGGQAQDVVKEAIQTATLCLKIAEMFSKCNGARMNWNNNEVSGMKAMEN